MQLNKAGIERLIEKIVQAYLQRALARGHKECVQSRGHVLFMVGLVGGLASLPVHDSACAECKSTSRFVMWLNQVWSKYAEKERLYNAVFIPREQLNGTWGVGYSELRNRGRFYVKHLEMQTVDNRYRRTDDSDEHYFELTIEAQDFEYNPAPLQHETLRLHGVPVQFAGRDEQETYKAELLVSWSQYGYMEKDGLVFVNERQAIADISDLSDWWLANPHAIPEQLSRLSVMQAIVAQEKWHAQLHKQAEKARNQKITDQDRTHLGELTIDWLVLMREGLQRGRYVKGSEPKILPIDASYVDDTRTYQVYEMKTGVALLQEGALMHNCIGSYTHHLWSSRFASIVGTGRNDSYSVHFRGNGSGVHILQARGFANRAIDSSEESYLVSGLARLT